MQPPYPVFPTLLSHFPAQHAPGERPTSLLIMLHGLGDTPRPYAALARRMQLPSTAALVLAGPLEVPETDGGRAWHEAFDEEWELIQVSRGGIGEGSVVVCRGEVKGTAAPCLI